MSKKPKSVNRLAVIEELKRRQSAQAAPAFAFDDFCFPEQKKFFRNPGGRFRTAVCSRRSGKCREAGTLVKTPTGSKKIEDLKPGDKVYGYDSDGVVRVCNVTQLHDQGIKEVVDLIWNRQVIATSTLDHKWLAHNTHKNTRIVKRLKDFNSRDRIAEEYVPIPGGTKVVKEAYALGTLLGTGCSRSNSGVVTSSADKSIYEHKKAFSLDEVRSWNRKSQLEFLAGLIDTGGSVYLTKDNRLNIRLTMQTKQVVENVQLLVLDLFQYKPCIRTNNRAKHKNGPVYDLSISNNKFSKRILKELPLVAERKKWKSNYESLNERSTSSNYTGFKLSKPRKAQCYDITIDNDTHLFLDANGLIGHNTVGIAADAIDTCLNNKDATCLYITMTKQNARNIIWGDLQKIVEEYKLDCKMDNTRLSIKFPNGSRIACEGVKDRTEIEKYRGWKLKKAYIDECQSFRPYLDDLVRDVIIPALRDERGKLYLTGTPGPVLAGPFYEYTQSDMWDSYHWTAFSNPFMHNPPELDLEETLKEERDLFGIDENDPGYRRETYGLWIEDVDSLVFKFSKSRNVYKRLPTEGEWYHIFGVDIGYNDADAIAVLGYNTWDKKVYLIEEVLKTKQDITSLVEEIKTLQAHYKPVKMVMDAGALGRKVQEEIQQRHELVIEAAEKYRKVEFIELLNDDLKTGKFQAIENSVFEEDCMRVQWDRESKIRNPDRPKISDVFHSDICDAVLYAWRECRHYLSERPETKAVAGTDQYMEEMEAKEAEDMRRQREDPEGFAYEKMIENDFNDMSDFDDFI